MLVYVGVLDCRSSLTRLEYLVAILFVRQSTWTTKKHHARNISKQPHRTVPTVTDTRAARTAGAHTRQTPSVMPMACRSRVC